jgi:hypothetical protein
MAAEPQKLPTIYHSEVLVKMIDELMGYEKTNRHLIKALARRLDALERGEPETPTITHALRAEDI